MNQITGNIKSAKPAKRRKFPGLKAEAVALGVTTREAVLEVLTLMNECWNETRRGSSGIVNGALDVVIDGVIETDLAVMRYPVRDTMCSEVLQTILAWTQDAIVETDYSVHPPIVSVRRLPNMPMEVVTLPADRATGLELKPRYDLQLGGVKIWYKKIHSNTVDNSTVSGQRWYVDQFPADLSDYYPDARIHTVDLEGSGQGILTQKISADSIAVNNASNSVRTAWWQKKFPWLADIRIKPASISVTFPTAEDKDGDPITDIADFLTDLPNELTAGSLSQWMGKNQAAVTFTAKVNYERYNDPIATPPAAQTYTAGLLGERVVDKSISCHVLATNAGPGSDLVFKTFSYFDTGEAIPYGLAQQIYESHETLQHEGVVELVGAEIPERLRLGILLTLLTPGATYADMLIQRVSGDLSRGRMQLQVGPPSPLGITDMIELHMVSRYRTTVNLPSNAANPVADSGVNYSLPEQTHRRDSTSGSGGSSYDAVTSA